MSRNDSKLGEMNSKELFEQEVKVAQAPRVQNAPIPDLLVNPTKYVELPSKGQKYPPDHPLYNRTEVEIKLMTTAEENILTNKSLMNSGETFNKFLRNVIVDKTIDPETMLSGDRSAVIIASRIYGYGSNYPTSARCPMCGKTLNQSVDLNVAVQEGLEALDQIEDVEKEFDVQWTSHKTFTVPLKNTGWIAECKLLEGEDEKKQFELDKRKKTAKQKNPSLADMYEDKPISEFLYSIIVSIDGNDGFGPRKGQGELKKIIDNLPSIDGKIVKDVYKLINPRVSLYQRLVCECGYEGVAEVRIGPDFFPII